MNKNNYFALIAIFILISSLTLPSVSALYNNENIINPLVNQYENLNSLFHRILELINIERSKFNLNPLAFDEDLNSAAMIRSEEIIQYFEHKRPDYREITTISSKIQGENIASGQNTPELLVESWMNSKDHRKNILDPDFTLMGLGYTYVENDSNEKGTHYWVQLFGGKKPTINVIDKTIYITLIQVKGLTFYDYSSNKICLKWNPQNSINANGYQIFKYNHTTKTYTLKKTIVGNNNNKFYDSYLTSLTSYKYKVRSYKTVNGKNYYGNFSTVATGTTKPLKPSLKLYSKGRKINVSWNKITKARGYEIYRSKKIGGKYSLRKIVKTKYTTKFIENKMKKGKYYYKIRSYGIVNNQKIYSSFSSPNVVKIL